MTIKPPDLKPEADQPIEHLLERLKAGDPVCFPKPKWEDDGRWGPRARQVAHPAFVEYVEDMIDRGQLLGAFRLIANPSLFYGLPELSTTPVDNCPELRSGKAATPPTDAELRHLAAEALRAAADITVAVYTDCITTVAVYTDCITPEPVEPWMGEPVIRIQGLPLTEEIVEVLVSLIAPPGMLRGETQPDTDLSETIARIVRRKPAISNRSLARLLNVSESTIRRYRPRK